MMILRSETTILRTFIFATINRKKKLNHKHDDNQLVTLCLDSKPVSVLCQMWDFGCGVGGGTMVKKIDGNKVHFVLFCTFCTGFLICIIAKANLWPSHKSSSVTKHTVYQGRSVHMRTYARGKKNFYSLIAFVKAYLHCTTLSHATSLRQAYDMT